MARINVEECWWSDPRRTKLLLKIGFAADAAAVNMWRTAQEYWSRGHGLIPKATFDTLEFASQLLSVGLAVVKGEEVYVCGSSDYLDWLNEKREAGSRGGKVSAQRQRDEKGRLLPKHDPSSDPSRTNQIQPSGSGSGSGSGSNTKIQNTKSFSTVAKDFAPVAKEKALVVFDSGQNLIEAFDPVTIATWVELYPDETYRRRELLRAWDYYRSNIAKRPKTMRGWKRALSSWFERGWPKHVAKIPGHTRPPSISEILAEGEASHV